MLLAVLSPAIFALLLASSVAKAAESASDHNGLALFFVPEAKADVILQSSDGYTFPVRQLSLQAASDVFEEVFASFADGFATDEETGFPLVTVQDKAIDLDLFLRFVVRDQDRRAPGGGHLSIEETMTLIRLARGYGAGAIVDMVDLSSLKSVVGRNPPILFGFAMAHGLHETARDALALFQKQYSFTVIEDRYHRRVGDAFSAAGGLPYLLSEIPRRYLASIPNDVMHDLLGAQDRVLLHGSKWANEAKKIKLT